MDLEKLVLVISSIILAVIPTFFIIKIGFPRDFSDWLFQLMLIPLLGISLFMIIRTLREL